MHAFRIFAVYWLMLIFIGCSKKDTTPAPDQGNLKPEFTFSIVDNGHYPVHVNFTNESTGARSYRWSFDNGDMSSSDNPTDSFFNIGIFNVKLIAIDGNSKDSVTHPVVITINKPKADFSFTVTDPYSLPLSITTLNNSTQALSYKWDFGNGDTSNARAPAYIYKNGGIYTIKLIARNPVAADTVTKQIQVSPYQQIYTSFDGNLYNLYAWQGKTVMLLMRTPNLNPSTMFSWVKVLDSAYGYYYSTTGQFPSPNPGVTFINNHVTIADVTTTCGAGCGYLGATGIEMLNPYTDRMYSYALSGQYDQELFYECGRNFWYYSSQLAYKDNDPIVTGYAVFMRFMSMDATGIVPAPFNTTPWTDFRSGVEGLVDSYTGNSTYNWNNTLGVGAGISNPLNLGATDLFASFCIRLKRDYGGEPFVQKLWKQAGLRPDANSTQDAVDNFILAACAAANKNLSNLFTVTWRWPMSDAAKTAAAKYP